MRACGDWIGSLAMVGFLTASMIGAAEPAAVRAAATTEPATDGPIASPEPDWPQWGGRRRDAVSDEKGLLPSWPDDGPRLLWKIGSLGQGWSSPIVVRDRLYITGDIGEDLVIFAFDLDGKPVWRTTNGRAWSGSFPGARACCAYARGKLYHMNAHGRVACLDAASGRELWAVDVLQRFQGQNITWAISECLLVHDSRLIVTPGGEKALMAALDADSGQTLWTTPPLTGDHTSHCSPLLFRHAGKPMLASCSSTHGFAVAADTGKLLWMVPLPSPYGVNVATPVYHAGKIFYLTPYVVGTCYQLRAGAAGPEPKEAWTTTLDTCTGTVLVVDGLLYGSGYRKHKSWLCLDWNSGQPRHEFKGLTTSAAVYADGRLYCLAEDGRAALLSVPTQPMIDGPRSRVAEPSLAVQASLSVPTQPTIVGPRSRAAEPSSAVQASVKPGPDAFTPCGQFRLMPQKVRDAWAHPVLLNGRLYLRYHDTLWCYEVRKQ